MAEALGRAAWRFERFVNYDMPRVQLLGHVTLRIAAITKTYLAGREAIIFYGEHFATRAGDRNIPRIPPNQDRVKDTPRLRPKELPKGPPKPVKPPKPKKYPWWVWVLRAAGFSDDAIELIIKNSL